MAHFSMPTELSLAERIAREAHRGQIEESTGDDYINHVQRVVNLVEGPKTKAVAWLHDVIEDAAVTETDLHNACISEDVIRAVVLLTRVPSLTYEAYVQRIKDSENPLAIAVKIADLKDHLRPNCPERLRSRYQDAWRVLTPV